MIRIEIPPPTPKNLLIAAAMGFMIWVAFETFTDPRSNCQWYQDWAAMGDLPGVLGPAPPPEVVRQVCEADKAGAKARGEKAK